jgi:Helicase associated domain
MFREKANKQKDNESKLKKKMENKLSKERVAEALKLAKAVNESVISPSKSSNKKRPPSEEIITQWKSSASWEERIEELKHFKTGNNHCRVPLRQPGLGRWVGDMRAAKKLFDDGKSDTPLTEERIVELDALGFEWNLGKPTIPWESRFADLLKFRDKTGHCNVPRSYKEDPTLGEWVRENLRLLWTGVLMPFLNANVPLFCIRIYRSRYTCR